MGYRHINNLSKNSAILIFKQCYATEKIHGTSAHIKYNSEIDNLTFFSGGANHQTFVELFDKQALLEVFRTNAIDHPDKKIITIYGEAYGGKIQKMKTTYGDKLKFIAFEVSIDGWFVNVKQAHDFVNKFGLEFVPYEIIDCTPEALEKARMAESIQAIRNGCGPGKKREGIVLRPLQEFIDVNGGRIIAKYKQPDFEERATAPRIQTEEEKQVLAEAQAIADEWVVPNRLDHVLDHLIADGTIDKPDMKWTNKIIIAMIEDVIREAGDEIIDSKPARKAISKKTAVLLKNYLFYK